MKVTKNKQGYSLLELSISILIVSILILAVSKGSRILSESKLQGARILTTNSPINVNAKSLAFWLETTSNNSFDANEVVDGSKISNWYDINPTLLGNGFDVNQAGDKRPTYVRDATNGLPALRFDGIDDFFIKENVVGSNLSNNGSEVIVFIVQKYYSPYHGSSSIDWTTSSNNRLNLHAVWSDSNFYFDFGSCCANGSGRTYFAVPLSYPDQTNIITAVRSGENAFVRINGVQYHDDSGLPTDFAIDGQENFYISRESYGTYQKGDINEIIIFKKSLKNSKIEAIEKYLSTKWGIPLNGL
ncbi:MAG: prepilin-type N-terminal cleavage/methylation domain-containing protein [Lentimonas sp.]|jgi:prepilin-type N-terminal cleavage/methylation domain-containing protein